MEISSSINSQVESWITAGDLPTNPLIKVVHINSPNHGLSEDEIEDRNEFIRCYILSDFEALMMIPDHTPETDFFLPDVDVTHDAYSAFNTVDFQKTRKPFDRYAYAMKMIMERILDLAIIHSSASSPEGREHTYQRYQWIVEVEFRERLLTLVAQYRDCFSPERRLYLKQKIAEINRRIMDCKRVWERYAPPETWDR